MKTSIRKNGDTLVVCVEGRLNHEEQLSLKDNLERIIHAKVPPEKQDQVPTKFIFNFEGLEFVGSTGISTFVQTLKDFNHRPEVNAKFCNVKSEFQRIFKALDDEQIFEFFNDERDAIHSYNQ